MAKLQALDGDVPNRALLAAAQFDQLLQVGDVKRLLVQVEPLGRIDIERLAVTVQEPLARRIEFLEYVFDHHVVLVDGAMAVLLPAAFQGQAVLVLADDTVVDTAPTATVQGVQIAAGRGVVFLGSLVHRGQLGHAVKVSLAREVRKSGHVQLLVPDGDFIKGTAVQ